MTQVYQRISVRNRRRIGWVVFAALTGLMFVKYAHLQSEASRTVARWLRTSALHESLAEQFVPASENHRGMRRMELEQVLGSPLTRQKVEGDYTGYVWLDTRSDLELRFLFRGDELVGFRRTPVPPLAFSPAWELIQKLRLHLMRVGPVVWLILAVLLLIRRLRGTVLSILFGLALWMLGVALIRGDEVWPPAYPFLTEWWRGRLRWPTPAIMLGSVMLIWLRGRLTRRRPGCCVCGYDLRGNVSGICPECGRSVTVEAV